MVYINDTLRETGAITLHTVFSETAVSAQGEVPCKYCLGDVPVSTCHHLRSWLRNKFFDDDINKLMVLIIKMILPLGQLLDLLFDLIHLHLVQLLVEVV